MWKRKFNVNIPTLSLKKSFTDKFEINIKKKN